MKHFTSDPAAEPSSVVYSRCIVDLKTGIMTDEDVPCRNLEDVLAVSAGHSRYWLNVLSGKPIATKTR